MVWWNDVSKTVTYARYFKLGRFVTAEVSLAVTGSGTSSTAVEVGLPVTAATSNIIVGTFYLSDVSTSTVHLGAAVLAQQPAGPAAALHAAVDAWLDISAEREIRQLVLVDAPNILGWNGFRDIAERYSLVDSCSEVRQQSH